ncbi:MAG: hypothetical protein IJX87_04835 [Clostridia bacterium]|nr:hypothetical protein [Clostridia bacterium]
MTVKLIKLLHLLGVDALLLGLFEKIMLWTIKTLEHWLALLEKFTKWAFHTISNRIAATKNLLVKVITFHSDALS